MQKINLSKKRVSARHLGHCSYLIKWIKAVINKWPTRFENIPRPLSCFRAICIVPLSSHTVSAGINYTRTMKPESTNIHRDTHTNMCVHTHTRAVSLACKEERVLLKSPRCDCYPSGRAEMAVQSVLGFIWSLPLTCTAISSFSLTEKKRPPSPRFRAMACRWRDSCRYF